MSDIVLKKYEPVEIPKTRKIRVCFYSNSPNIRTGFAKVIREIGSRLARDPSFEIHCIGENYQGPPQDFQNMKVWGIIPENRNDQRTYFEAVMKTLQEINPDVLIILEDSFTLGHQNWND